MAKPKQAPQSRYLSRFEVAAILGISPSGVVRLHKRGKLPYVVIGDRRILTDASDLEAYCERLAQRPARRHLQAVGQ